MKLKIKYVSPLIGTQIPEPNYATEGAAGMDLVAAIEEDVILKKGESTIIPTGIAIELENNNVAAFLYARSGLGIKHNICLSNGVGVIDSDYRGEIKVGLINQGQNDYTIKKGERIAQMVIQNIIIPEIEICDTLSDTDRGDGGLGSTGRL